MAVPGLHESEAMKIERIPSPTTIRFDNVKNGTLFEYEGRIWIRVKPNGTAHALRHEHAAVLMSDGMYSDFTPSLQVELVTGARLVIG